MARLVPSLVEELVENLDRSYNTASWHGPNLRGALRGVNLATAGWRPSAKRHNIWEVMVHCAYWKYVVWRRLTGQKRGSFPLKGSNWFTRPDPDGAATWKSDLALLDEMHQRLRDAVGSLALKQLEQRSAGSKVSHRALIAGAAAHDVYHAGQIQLLKKLAGDALA